MFDQMKQMVYDQTEQNVMEKKKLVNTLLDNYNQATIKFLYYTDEVQEYLNTRQSVLSVEEQEAVDIMRKALNGMKSEEATENILNMFARTKDNAEFVQTIKKQRILS